MTEAEQIMTGLDDWCKKRARRLTERASQHILRGHDPKLIDPEYRAWLGEHRAYTAMRSYIHGSLRAVLKGEG